MKAEHVPSVSLRLWLFGPRDFKRASGTSPYSVGGHYERGARLTTSRRPGRFAWFHLVGPPHFPSRDFTSLWRGRLMYKRCQLLLRPREGRGPERPRPAHVRGLRGPDAALHDWRGQRPTVLRPRIRRRIESRRELVLDSEVR